MNKDVLAKINYLASTYNKVRWSKSKNAFIGYNFHDNCYWVEKVFVWFNEKTNTLNLYYTNTDFI